MSFAPESYLRYAGEEPWQLSRDALSFYAEHPDLLRSSFETWLDPMQAAPLHEQFDLHVDWEREKRLLDPHDESVPDEEREAIALRFASFPLEFCSDAPLKFDQSGLGAYELAIPNGCADAPLLNEWHRTTFVHYLRTCMRWAGLPGLELFGNPPEELAALTEGLLPF
jgi:hypothetical protein